MSLRLAFMGSPTFAVAPLQALIAAGHEIACVYSQPARPAGRGQRERPTPVAALAAAHGLEVRTPKTLKRAEEQAAFAALELDAAIVVAYGLILPKAILEAPRLGCFNLHASLLPRWRGAAPIQRAIMAGDRITGVQVMRMEEGLDTGPILASVETAIAPDDNAGTLHDRLSRLGATLLVETLSALEAGRAQERSQAGEGATYAHKIAPGETRIEWTRPAHEIACAIRALAPSPGAWCTLGGARLKLLHARAEPGQGAPGQTLDDRLLVACGEGALRILRLQREGRAPLDAEDFLRGQPVPQGVLFG